MARHVAVLVFVLVIATAQSACAATAVYLQLRIDGTAIEGDSTATGPDLENSIECISYEHTVSSPREDAIGPLTGRRQHTPIKIRKRIDKTSPLLIKALTENEVCYGTFLFVAPPTGGSGAIAHRYSVEFTDAYITSVRQFVPEPSDVATGLPPLLEEVEFVFRTIRFTHTDNGASHLDGGGPRATADSTAPTAPTALRRIDDDAGADGQQPRIRMPGGRIKPR